MDLECFISEINNLSFENVIIFLSYIDTNNFG
jgi:hypothetical protein